MLEVKKLCHIYLQANIEISFNVKQGSCVALMGASGSGKSTLINMIAGFTQPSSGTVWFDQQLLNSLKPAARPLTVLFQSGNLFQHLTVWQNIAIGLDSGMRLSPQQHQKVADALHSVDLAGFDGRKPGTLSGGQQQRVALARCFARNQPLLLLDEPFNGLDLDKRQMMLAIVQTLQRQEKITVLLTTHQRAEAEQIAEQIIMLD